MKGRKFKREFIHCESPMMVANRYNISFDGTKTLNEFLEEIKKENEYGTIYIGKISLKNEKLATYKDEKVELVAGEEMLNKNIKSITAIGDWGLMDYFIEFLEEEHEFISSN